MSMMSDLLFWAIEVFCVCAVSVVATIESEGGTVATVLYFCLYGLFFGGGTKNQQSNLTVVTPYRHGVYT